MADIWNGAHQIDMIDVTTTEMLNTRLPKGTIIRWVTAGEQTLECLVTDAAGATIFHSVTLGGVHIDEMVLNHDVFGFVVTKLDAPILLFFLPDGRLA